MVLFPVCARLGCFLLGCFVGSLLSCMWAASRVPQLIYLRSSYWSLYPKKGKVCSDHLKLSRTFIKSCCFLLLFKLCAVSSVKDLHLFAVCN
ncbi:hypothetical protein Hanom_Chr01g00060011 [Helianthus anomalus]